MPAPNVSDQLVRSSDLSLLMPAFHRRVDAVLARARAEGLPVHVFEALRSNARQEVLFAQGRSLPGPVITNARAGESWHQYAVAVDFAFDGQPDTLKVEWSWNGNWARLGVIIQEAGLEWLGAAGSTFKEAPHAQMRGGLSTAEAKKLKSAGGLPMVWAEIERRLGA